MEISIVDERLMPEPLDAAIRKGLCACFPADAGVFSKTRAWHGSASSYSVVCEDGGEVVAHIGVVDRRISAGGSELRVAGVQNVFVLPSMRGTGLCGKLMASAMEEAARRDFDCGLLFCVPKLEKAYAASGWIGLGVREVTRIEDGREIPIPDKNIAMYRPLAEPGFPDGSINLGGNDW